MRAKQLSVACEAIAYLLERPEIELINSNQLAVAMALTVSHASAVLCNEEKFKRIELAFKTGTLKTYRILPAFHDAIRTPTTKRASYTQPNRKGAPRRPATDDAAEDVNESLDDFQRSLSALSEQAMEMAVKLEAMRVACARVDLSKIAETDLWREIRRRREQEAQTKSKLTKVG